MAFTLVLLLSDAGIGSLVADVVCYAGAIDRDVCVGVYCVVGSCCVGVVGCCVVVCCCDIVITIGVCDDDVDRWIVIVNCGVVIVDVVCVCVCFFFFSIVVVGTYVGCDVDRSVDMNMVLLLASTLPMVICVVAVLMELMCVVFLVFGWCSLVDMGCVIVVVYVRLCLCCCCCLCLH